MFMSEDLKTAHPKYEDSVNICFYMLGAPKVYPEQLRFVSPSNNPDIRLIWWEVRWWILPLWFAAQSCTRTRMIIITKYIVLKVWKLWKEITGIHHSNPWRQHYHSASICFWVDEDKSCRKQRHDVVVEQG